MQTKHAITAASKGHIVSDDNRGELMLAVQTSDKFEDALRGSAIEIAGWFVGKQQFRACHQRPCESDSLLLSPGELSGTMMHAISQPNLL